MYRKFLTCIGVCFLMGCSDMETQERESRQSPGSRIDEKVAEYKSCLSNEDYICATSFILPALVRSVGGADNMVRILEQLPLKRASRGLTLDPTKTIYETHNKVVVDGKTLVSVVPSVQYGTYHGEKAEIHGSLIAFSYDKGKTWFFLEGSDENQLVIANENPQLLQSIKVPVPIMKIGDTTFIQKNDLWIKQEPEDQASSVPKDTPDAGNASVMKY